MTFKFSWSLSPVIQLSLSSPSPSPSPIQGHSVPVRVQKNMDSSLIQIHGWTQIHQFKYFSLQPYVTDDNTPDRGGSLYYFKMKTSRNEGCHVNPGIFNPCITHAHTTFNGHLLVTPSIFFFHFPKTELLLCILTVTCKKNKSA